MARNKDDDFDGYRKWLGIPETKRPPTHYQLLAVSLDEDDPEVIRAAAEQRRHYVGSKRGEGHDTAVTEIVYQINEAEATLLNQEMRRDYDRQMRLFEKRRKKRQVDPFASRSNVTSPSRLVATEDTGIVKTFAGIMAVIVVGFGVMAWFSFQLPWSKKVDNVQAAPQLPAKIPDPAPAHVAQVPAPAQVAEAAAHNEFRKEPTQNSVPVQASNEQQPKPLKLNEDYFQLSGRYRVQNGNGIEFLKGNNVAEQSNGKGKEHFVPPIAVTFEVTASPDACLDIFPGILGNIRFAWGVEFNKKTRVVIGREKTEIPHIPIQPNKNNVIILKVDKNRRLTINVNGTERYSRIVDANIALSGPIVIGGGIGHVTYTSVVVDQRAE